MMFVFEFEDAVATLTSLANTGNESRCKKSFFERLILKSENLLTLLTTNSIEVFSFVC